MNMNNYTIFFRTLDDVEGDGLSKCIHTFKTMSTFSLGHSFETKATFSVGDTIMDNNCNEFTIVKVTHFVGFYESSTTRRHKTEIHCVADSLTQKDVEKLDDWK
jgi:hypothetical protein